jgi:hypothetical protein
LRGSLSAPGDEGFHGGFFAFGGNPDASIGEVPDLPGYAQFICHFFGTGPEEDTLYPTLNGDLFMYFSHISKLLFKATNIEAEYKIRETCSG